MSEPSKTRTRIRRALIGLAVLALFVLVFWLLRPVLLTLLIASILAYLMDPVVEYLAARKVPRVVSSIGIMVLAAAVLIMILVLLIPAVGQEIQTALSYLPEWSELMSKYAKPYIAKIDKVYPGGVDMLTRKAIDVARENAPKMLAPLATFVGTMFSSVVNFILSLLNLILIPVMTYFLLRDIQKIRAGLKELLPPRWRADTSAIVREVDRVLSSFVRGQLIVCTILALMYGIGLSILRVPMALFWALLGGYGNLIPYVGTISAATGAMLFSLMHYHDLKRMILTGAVFAIAQTLEGTVIGPRVVGESVGLNPVIIMLTVIVGGSLFGFAGMLLAVPTVAVAAVFVRHARLRYLRSDFYLKQ